MSVTKAIQTKYNGCLFRSRLEARWAVFLDALGIRYRYEIEGFDLDGEWYLPDFWLPYPHSEPHPEGAFGVQGYWIEIKPNAPNDREMKLLSALAKQTKHTAFLFYGDPHPGEFDINSCSFRGRIQRSMLENLRLDLNKSAEAAEKQGIGRSLGRYSKQSFPIGHALCGFLFNLTRKEDGEYTALPGDKEVRAALQSARSARFEHGERP